MQYKVTILNDDDYDLDDDIPAEIDFSRVRRDTEREERFRSQARIRLSRTVCLDEDVAAFFPSSEAVNEALRRVMQDTQKPS